MTYCVDKKKKKERITICKYCGFIYLAGLLPDLHIIFDSQTSFPFWGAWKLLSMGEKFE